MNETHKELHDFEDQLIEINGLMKALQSLLPDGSKHTCVANALEEKLECLQQQFYLHWHKTIAGD